MCSRDTLSMGRRHPATLPIAEVCMEALLACSVVITFGLVHLLVPLLHVRVPNLTYPLHGFPIRVMGGQGDSQKANTADWLLATKLENRLSLGMTANCQDCN